MQRPIRELPHYLRHGVKFGGSDSWQTPLRLYRNLDREFSFTIDAAASAANALHNKYWSAEDDALAQDWSGHTVFCNPPYSRVEEFLAKGREADTAVFIIPARTGTTYFLEHVFSNKYCHEIRWCHRGIRFIPADEIEHNEKRRYKRAPLPCCIIVYKNIERKGDIRQTSICADTLLTLSVIATGSKRGRPTIYDWQDLDRIITLWDKKNIRTVAELSLLTGIPKTTLHRIVDRIGR